MIKTVVIPQKNTFNLLIPNNYIGKKVEILLYSLDEVIEEKNSTPKKSMADFNGILSETDYQSLKTYTEEARSEWNRTT